MIRPVKKNGFYIPVSGDPRLHEEIEWFATDDDAVLGVVIRRKVDEDFAWVVLMTDQGPAFRAVDVQSSLPSQEDATEKLHAAMNFHYTARRAEADLNDDA